MNYNPDHLYYLGMPVRELPKHILIDLLIVAMQNFDKCNDNFHKLAEMNLEIMAKLNGGRDT